MGAGKRTVAKAAADKVGIAFHEVPLSLPWPDVSEALFGRRDAAGDWLPGLLQPNGRVLIYLSNLEEAEPAAQIALAGLFTSGRAYLTGVGWVQKAEDVWLVAGMSTADDRGVIPDDLLSRSVRRRYRVEVPTGDDLAAVALGILDGLAPGREFDPDALPLLARCLEMDDNLRSLRRWIETALLYESEAAGTPLTRQALKRAITQDLHAVVSGLQYRGGRVSMGELEAWLDQFPEDLRAIGVHLARTVARTYFIDTASYYQSIAMLASRIRAIAEGHGERGRVVMCGWQHMGKSAPTVAHDLKIEALFDVASDIDLRRPHDWPSDPGSSIFVIPDDVVGSGRTLRSLVAPPARHLTRLLERYPGGHVVIAVIAAYVPGVQDALSHPDWPHDRVDFVNARSLRPTDMCFADASRIIPDPQSRTDLAAFCERMAAERMRGLGFPLGFGGLGSLVVLPMDVPNNSLPLLWHQTGDWSPLFRASRP